MNWNTFSPRGPVSVQEFCTRVRGTFPRKDLFLIPVAGRYLTIPWSEYSSENTWCYSDSGRVVMLLDKTLIFQPGKSEEYMYTKDGKTYRQLDEDYILKIYKKYTELLTSTLVPD